MSTYNEKRHSRIDLFRTQSPSGEWVNKEAVSNAHKLYDVMTESSVPEPGIFAGEEVDDVRFEWSGPKEITVVECLNDGGYSYYYLNENRSITHELETQEEVIALLPKT